MNTEINFQIVDVDNSQALESYRSVIAELFLTAFGKPLDPDLWTWAYLDNPFGQPLVSMAFHEGQLVGHYAVVPMDLKNDKGAFKGYLSMTTMVHSDYRRHQLFRSLAERVYQRIEQRGEPAMVFGFPNNQSAPGFIKRLEWTVSEAFHVVALQPEDLPQAQQLLADLSASSYRLSLTDPLVAAWRCAKPKQSWQLINGIGIKPHQEGLDLMYLAPEASLAALDLTGPLHAIMPVSSKQAEELGWEISFPYRFGYRTFNTQHEPTFSVQMCMSDIF